MNMKDELEEQIFDDIVADIITADVEVEEPKKWNRFLSLSRNYNSKYDALILKRISNIFRANNYPFELIYTEDDREIPEFAFDCSFRYSFKFLVKFFEVITKMPLFLTYNIDDADAEVIKNMTLVQFIRKMKPAWDYSFIERRILALQKREIKLYYEENEIKRHRGRMCWNHECKFDIDFETEHYIQIKRLENGNEKLYKTTYQFFREEPYNRSRTTVRMSELEFNGLYLTRVICGSRWTSDYNHQIHYMILVIKSLKKSDVYWYTKDSADISKPKFWVEFRRSILSQLVGSDATPIYKRIEFEEFKSNVYKNRHQNRPLISANFF